MLAMLAFSFSAHSQLYWKGGSTNWNSGTNWSLISPTGANCSCTPNAGTDVVINTVGTNKYPVVNTGTINTRDIEFIGNGKVVLNTNATLSINGSFNNTTTNLNVIGGAGRVVFARGASTANVNITGDSDFRRVEITGSNAGNSITITSGTTINIHTSLLVGSGTLYTNGGLVLLSPFDYTYEYCDGTAYIDGSGGGEISGDVTIQVCIFEPYKTYRHIGSPIHGTSNTIGTQLDADDFDSSVYPTNPGHYDGTYVFTLPVMYPPDLFYYDEDDYDPNPSTFTYPYHNYVWPDKRFGWMGISSGSYVMTPGYGIAARFLANDHLIDFTGPVNNGDVDITLSFNSYEPSTDNDGWNLIANPYPSPIDVNYFCGASDISDIVAVYVNDGDEWTGTHHYYDICDPFGYTGDWTDGLLSIGQGFWIQATDATTFTFENSMRVNENYVTFYKQDKPATSRLGFVVNAGNKKDETLIVFDNNASSTYNKKHDAGKITNELPAHNIFTLKGDVQTAVNKLPIDKFSTDIPLNLILSTTDNASLECSRFVKNDPNLEYWFEDYLLGTRMLITEGFVYPFESNSTTIEGRFNIKVLDNTMKTSAENNPSIMQAVVVKQQLDITLGQDLDVTGYVTITDAVGKVVFQKNVGFVNGKAISEIPLLSSGIYLINVSNSSMNSTQKVFVSNH